MGKKLVMLPADQVKLSDVKYEPENIKAPHLTGFTFKLFVKLLESSLIGSSILSSLKNENGLTQILRNTVIPESPMFNPEFPPQGHDSLFVYGKLSPEADNVNDITIEPEHAVTIVDEDARPVDRVESALKCLPHYDPAVSWNADSTSSFRYWKIRDYAHAYRSKLTTPSKIAEQIISVIEEFGYSKAPTPLLISFDADEVRKQALASTRRFEEGNPLSILDGIFMAIKDDIDCLPHPSNGGTTWMHEVRSVEKDAVCVSRLRTCGVIFLGKANMHEIGMGTTGNNSNYGTARNPHAPERYTGGSSSGPAAIVATGLCSAALGTDGGGSVRIPAALCGITGLKSTYGRTDKEGSLCQGGTVDIIGPIASSVEDCMLVYAAILGSSSASKISLNPGPPCLPNLSHYSSDALGSLRLGKYTAWFNDVHSSDISDKCEDILNQLTKSYGCEVVEIVVPELQEMRAAHTVSIGSETLSSLTPHCENGYGSRLTYDSRTSFALFRSFTASDYVASQRLRRRLMHYHMEIFKNVDVIVTPTTGMTAPVIPPNATKYGETNMYVSAYLMRFVISANLLGLPAISVPVGYDKQGLPIGLQIIGRPWAEASILRLASVVEELCPDKRKPVQFYDVLKTN